MSKELYDLLGVKSMATAAEIKKAFRTLSKTMHPDKGGDTETYQKITEAYDVLMNPHKRLAYDTTGATNTRSALEDLGKFAQTLLDPENGLEFLKVGFRYLTGVEPTIIELKKSIERSIKGITEHKATLDKQDGEWPRVSIVMSNYIDVFQRSLEVANSDLTLCQELIKEYREVMGVLGIPTIIVPERPRRGRDMGIPQSFSFMNTGV